LRKTGQENPVGVERGSSQNQATGCGRVSSLAGEPLRIV